MVKNAQSAMLCQSLSVYSAWNLKDKYNIRANFVVVQFNGFMSLTSYLDDKYMY
jgi:hypothetical protein